MVGRSQNGGGMDDWDGGVVDDWGSVDNLI